MIISDEEYQKALKIVIQYESEYCKNERETLKRENYKKPLEDILHYGLQNIIRDLNFDYTLGIDLKMTVGEFILLDINWEYYLNTNRFGDARKNKFRNFLKEYKLK